MGSWKGKRVVITGAMRGVGFESSDGGRRMLEVCSLPWTETGKFWYGKDEIPY